MLGCMPLMPDPSFRAPHGAQDILMRQELEDLASVNLDRFKVSYCLTTPPAGWDGLSGRGSVSGLFT